MPGRTAKVKRTNRLIAAMMLSAACWPVWTCAQPAPDAMAKTAKPDEMKWESLGGGIRDFNSLHEPNDPGDVSCDTWVRTRTKTLALVQ